MDAKRVIPGGLSAHPVRCGAERCIALGLANRMVAAASLVDESVAWAASLAARAPLSLAATKKAMRFAAFLEKRKPRFEGR